MGGRQSCRRPIKSFKSTAFHNFSQLDETKCARIAVSTTIHIAYDRAHMGFGKLWKMIMQFSRTWKVLEEERLSKLLWKSFEFLLRNILKYPKNGYNLVKY